MDVSETVLAVEKVYSQFPNVPIPAAAVESWHSVFRNFDAKEVDDAIVVLQSRPVDPSLKFRAVPTTGDVMEIVKRKRFGASPARTSFSGGTTKTLMPDLIRASLSNEPDTESYSVTFPRPGSKDEESETRQYVRASREGFLRQVQALQRQGRSVFVFSTPHPSGGFSYAIRTR